MSWVFTVAKKLSATALSQYWRVLDSCIEISYNRQRLHSSLEFLTPAEYEAAMVRHHEPVHAAWSGCPANRVNSTPLATGWCRALRSNTDVTALPSVGRGGSGGGYD
jgi:hypothetical protein